MKTFVWIIGKPGSGKTTVGESLAKSNKDILHFSYGQLLKQVQPNPGLDGYAMADRERVNSLILNASKAADVVIVDGNPYSKLGFGFIEQIRTGFDQIKVVHLKLDDATAFNRLAQRSREVLAHDGIDQSDRIENFNKNLLPLIEEYKATNDVKEIEVGENKDLEFISNKVLEIIK